jgi:hypothetical protein
MHPDVLRAVASARVQDMIAAAERSDLVRQARRSPRYAQPRPAWSRSFWRTGRRARLARAGRLVAVGPAAVREPADGSGQTDCRAA